MQLPKPPECAWGAGGGGGGEVFQGCWRVGEG